jgi:hydroxypyruvate reductase
MPPDGVTLDDLRSLTNDLLRAGATIAELNAVRKHLDDIKGGRLARACSPARCMVLALSDVVGDVPDVIASGPFSPDPTTYSDAVRVVERFGLWKDAPAAVRAHLQAGVRGDVDETPKPGDPCFARVSYDVIGSARISASAACGQASALGYDAALLEEPVTGEARAAGSLLARRAVASPVQRDMCLVAHGETTVTVRGSGRGGRNQELALGAAIVMGNAGGVLVCSMGSDGIDGPTDAAGAAATGTTMARAQALGLDAQDVLQRNDTYGFFAALDDLIRSGPTGTNVMDVQIILRAPTAI